MNPRTLSIAALIGLLVLAGFTAASACVSFKNLDVRVAKRIVFDFPILGDGGQELAKLVLDRSGEFSPNVDIRSFESIGQWQGSAVGPVKSFMAGCNEHDLPAAALPFLQAPAAGYRVLQVDYVDGTS